MAAPAGGCCGSGGASTGVDEGGFGEGDDGGGAGGVGDGTAGGGSGDGAKRIITDVVGATGTDETGTPMNTPVVLVDEIAWDTLATTSSAAAPLPMLIVATTRTDPCET
eukprot:4185360-Prymnesium_polylepis.1